LDADPHQQFEPPKLERRSTVWRRLDGVWPEDSEIIPGEAIGGEPATVAGSVRLETIDMTLDFAEAYLWCDMTGGANGR
jgi:hypothetical protein